MDEKLRTLYEKLTNHAEAHRLYGHDLKEGIRFGATLDELERTVATLRNISYSCELLLEQVRDLEEGAAAEVAP